MTTHAPQQSRRSRSDTWIETLVLALIGALAVAALLSGCLAEEEEVPAVVDVPTWNELADTTGLFGTSCRASSCHDAISPAASLDLSADQYATIVTAGLVGSGSVLIVDPGNKAGSLLFQKTTTGGSMAGMAGAAGAEQIGIWIDAGAPEN